jgi:membrane-anchored protein YejM (alkaline phosphatase superfamily)
MQSPVTTTHHSWFSWRKLLTTFVMLIVLADKLIFAVADLYNWHEITRHRAVFPCITDSQ